MSDVAKFFACLIWKIFTTCKENLHEIKQTIINGRVGHEFYFSP